MKRKVALALTFFCSYSLLVSLFAKTDIALPSADWAFKTESKHYKIYSNASKDHSLELLKHMELVYRTYNAFLRPPSLPDRKFVLKLYKDRREYLRHGAPAGSGAYYDGRNLVGYYAKKQMLPFFSHEGMHQFTDIAIKNFHRMPMWYTEGIADCIGNSEVRRGKLYMALKRGEIAKLRVPVLLSRLKRGTQYKFKDLLRMKRRPFMRDGAFAYAQSWSLCHFLLTYPKREDRDKQIPNGRYKKMLVDFHNLMAGGKVSLEDAYKYAFRYRKRPLDWDDFTKRWKKYFLHFWDRK